jgi:acyl carrier protein phosphodiesterase
MNYLAHAFLSFGDTDILTGNMVADHVKGLKPLEALPAGIAGGILLHRKIDAFSDIHPAVARAKVWFREPYHLYAGPILDTLWDHFLANDPAAFSSEEDLKKFTLQTYAQLETTAEWHPEAFRRYFPHMKAYNWLFNYRNLQGARRSLEGLGRRALYMPPMQEAYEIFIGRYYQLAQCYYELMDDLLVYVKKETAALRA